MIIVGGNSPSSVCKQGSMASGTELLVTSGTPLGYYLGVNLMYVRIRGTYQATYGYGFFACYLVSVPY